MHTHKHIPHVFVLHIFNSSTLLREFSSFSHYMFHLQLIPNALLSSYSAIIWHFVLLYLFSVHSHRSSNHHYTQERCHQELEYVPFYLIYKTDFSLKEVSSENIQCSEVVLASLMRLCSIHCYV